MSEQNEGRARLQALAEKAAAHTLCEKLTHGAAPAVDLQVLAAALAAEGYDLTAAARGDATLLLSRLELSVLGHRRPVTLHAIALSFERLAIALEEHAAVEAALVAATSLRRRALEAWRLLAREQRYLGALLARISRSDEHDAIAAVVAERPEAVLAAWFEHARLAFPGRRPAANVLLRMLRALEEHCQPLAEAARRWRENGIELMLEPVVRRTDELRANGAAIADRLTALYEWEMAWRASGCDLYLAQCALEHVLHLGWELRSTGKHAALGQLHEHFAAMFEQMASDVALGGPLASFASSVADGFVQRASAPGTSDARMALCERALFICPRHKLAESMLAFFLAERGLSWLAAASGTLSATDKHQIEAIIRRARDYDPNDEKLLELLERYRRVTGIRV